MTGPVVQLRSPQKENHEDLRNAAELQKVLDLRYTGSLTENGFEILQFIGIHLMIDSGDAATRSLNREDGHRAMIEKQY